MVGEIRRCGNHANGHYEVEGLVSSCQEGFLHFLSCRAFSEPTQLWGELPVSLRTFFANFDDVMDMQHYVNKKPLLLRAVALQGIPVENKPCLDLWNASGEHVYSSHPDVLENEEAGGQNESDWAGEEGFYQVNQVVQGDFCLLCRFGGPFSTDYEDSSKIIFRYANTTAVLGGTTIELGFDHVDVQTLLVSCDALSADVLASVDRLDSLTVFLSHCCC